MPVIMSDTLKARHRLVRDDQPEGLRVRIHRAISWLALAEREVDDPDAAFIFLWIALNAAYAHEFGFEERELVQIRRFIAVLVEHDLEQRLHAVPFRQFSGPIRTLIDNRSCTSRSGARCVSTMAAAGGSSNSATAGDCDACGPGQTRRRPAAGDP